MSLCCDHYYLWYFSMAAKDELMLISGKRSNLDDESYPLGHQIPAGWVCRTGQLWIQCVKYMTMTENLHKVGERIQLDIVVDVHLYQLYWNMFQTLISECNYIAK